MRRATIRRMKSALKKLERQYKRLEEQMWALDAKIWDAEVKAVKPKDMCRIRWVPGAHCALRKGHKGGCQGEAPPLVYK